MVPHTFNLFKRVPRIALDLEGRDMGHHRPFRGWRAEATRRACVLSVVEICGGYTSTSRSTQRASPDFTEELQNVERRGRPSDASGSAGALTAAAELSSSTHRLTTARLVASAAAICCAHSSAAAIQRHGRRIVDRQRHSSATSASKLLAPASCRAHSDSRGRQANSVAGARQPQRDCFREATGRQVVRAGGQGGDPSAR